MSRGLEWLFIIRMDTDMRTLKERYETRFEQRFPMEPKVPLERLHLVIDDRWLRDEDTPRSIGMTGVLLDPCIQVWQLTQFFFLFTLLSCLKISCKRAN